MKIEIVPYRESWSVEYEKEKLSLIDQLGELIIKVHHIGSTSVHGLSAKPIIDILVEVKSLNALDENKSVFEALGYEVKGELVYLVEGIIEKVVITVHIISMLINRMMSMFLGILHLEIISKRIRMCCESTRR